VSPSSAAPPFHAVRIERGQVVPEPDPRIIDVAILDMNHAWPNLGHDSLVKAVGEIALDIEPYLDAAGLAVRVLSYDVRGGGRIPEAPGDRLRLYVGTGGPGHIDPRRNDGVSPGAQGIVEDPAWEAPLFRLFDAIRSDDTAALLAVCHSFGVICRWLGVARPVLRGPEKGGKSSGVRANVLTPEAALHPWFGRLAAELGGAPASIVDSRLFDLIPEPEPFPPGVVPIAYEAGAAGARGDALTMIEVARDPRGAMPRILAVNHHPEIRDLEMQRALIDRKLSRGEVSPEWCEERTRTLAEVFSDPETEARVMRTSHYTLLGPLRFHLYRQLRMRAAALGFDGGLDEEQVLRSLPVVSDPDAGLV
jgi:hypothetical protein